ncbi:endonuclease/exonuclease/phosphatase family protein [Streptomyces pini]|uniref:Endonuclease/Exonuclease/phosphatase family protein n=1 Tax=Streptomyces pini TaxID=1520580 RepID=A0A1I3XY39_9ACTN|nr:endonuclease/exonuclease/phosphatase family protein [Streptomyces pini]SFK24577.1 Endonuclease/Exonuclease/phosphatase family protein [Streptomyces pini]
MAATDAPGGDSSTPPAEEDTGRDAPGQAPDAPEEAPAARRWCWGTRLLVASTAVWTVLLALHVLLIGRWWPWLIVETTPPLTVVVVPVLLLVLVPFATPVRRRLSAVLVLLLLAGAYVADFGWTGTTAGSSRGTEVKVFAWSTDYWQMASDDKEAFYAFLRRQDADVYLLHEYLNWNYSNRDEQKKCTSPVRIDDSARLRAEFPGYRLLVQGELLTLSRLPVVAAPNQQVPATGDDWYWKGAKAQRTDIRVGRRTVSFYNVHLPIRFRPCDIRYGLDRFYQAGREQGDWWIREYRKLRADLGRNPHPAVVAGDFNAAWMNLYSLGAGTRPHNPSGSLFPALSWPACEGSCSLPRSWRALPQLWRFDWLFTTEDLAVSGYHLRGGEALSDHSAQKIRVVVPDQVFS